MTRAPYKSKPAPGSVADLVERARALADCDARAGEPLGKCLRECADEIERIRAALMTFARAAENFDGKPDYGALIHCNLTVGDLRRARDVLA